MTTANPLRELPDTNLHLAVLSRLMDMGTVPPFQVPAPDEHPVLSAFDNARVIKSLSERGVALAFE